MKSTKSAFETVWVLYICDVLVLYLNTRDVLFVLGNIKLVTFDFNALMYLAGWPAGPNGLDIICFLPVSYLIYSSGLNPPRSVIR